MSALTILQTATAICPNLLAQFSASGGTPPYSYAVRQIPAGAGGTINSSTGAYTAPAVVNGGSYGPPTKVFDTIMVTDSDGNTGLAQILVGTPLMLFCEIIQSQLGLKNGRVYLWDQKIEQPDDSGLYIAVAVMSCKPYSNVRKYDGSSSNSNQFQYVNNFAMLQLDVISRDAEARDRKEEVLMALNSYYAEYQMQANSFLIGKLPPGSQFINLSNQDGAAIPYRFNISVGFQFMVSKTVPIGYYGTFQTPQLNTNP